tara:strand:+ start:3919 stop:5172 length:1254 start_codon:yes stop_codon:yes gene_type:complete
VTITIIGAGIGGLTLALCLHERNVPCRIYEAAPQVEALGVGINLLPHATRILSRLGLEKRLAEISVETQELCFYNKYGQFIHSELRGRFAGYDWPQYSIRRGTLQEVLCDAVRERLGEDALVLDHRFVHAEQDSKGVTAQFVSGEDEAPRHGAQGSALVGCDGVHSAVRALLHPGDGPFRYSGVTMWRGVTRWRPYLTGASMTLVGWLATGKMVIYPIRHDMAEDDCHMVNWLCELECPARYPDGDWSRPGELGDFISACEDMRFDWLDVAGMVKAADLILEYPMVDKDPLPRWSFGRITLLGDAAHPMYPRGSNGAGQAILDADSLATQLSSGAGPEEALTAYESARLETTSAVVLANRTSPPDAILREVFERTCDQPFADISDVITPEEIATLSEGYKRVAGFRKTDVNEKAAST